MAWRNEYVSIAGARTHLIRGGRGKPVLVLHPEFAASQWFPYHDQLARRFHIYAPDHPGFGESERSSWVEDIDDVVFHYVELLDELRLEHVSVLGTSIGGWIAAELALMRPDRIDRLVLSAAAGIKIDGIERFDIFLHSIEETLQHLFHDPRRAAQLLPTQFGPEAIVRVYREATSLARLTWNPYLYNPKLEHRLRRITAPTLVIWGANDRFLPIPHGKAYADRIPGAELLVIPECGHLVPFEQTEQFVEHVSAFLDTTT